MSTGNVRVVADKDGNVEETNDYYPFGELLRILDKKNMR